MRRVMLPATIVVLLIAMVLILSSALLRPRFGALNNGGVRVEQVDTSAYPKINLYVSVADASGVPLAGLRNSDFAVTEDGVPVDLAAFAGAGADKVSSVLVMDRSGSMDDEEKIDGARQAATAFVELLRPGDRAALIAFNDEVEVAQRFTGDSAALVASIKELHPENGTALYDAVVAGVDLLRDQPGRRLLLVLSDGEDMRESPDPDEHPYGSKHTLQAAIAYAQAAGQPVAVVGLGDRASADDNGLDEAVLQQIATETGGRYFYAPQGNALTELYTGLAGNVQHEYRLTYVSPQPFYNGTRRDIQVQARGVLGSSGYTEQHLINVASNPLVGVALLLPLAGLLVVPVVLRRRSGKRVAGAVTPSAASPAVAPSPAPSVATMAAPVADAHAEATPVASTLVVGSARNCVSCGATLRSTARFCSTCGTTQPTQPAPDPERRTFCDMCGRPLLDKTAFCMNCGEPVAQRRPA